MVAREAPIFPGVPAGTVVVIPENNNASHNLFTAGSDGGLVSGINVFCRTNTSVTVELNLTVGGTTATLMRKTLSSLANNNTNLIKAADLTFIDDSEPLLPIPANGVLSLSIETPGANQLEIYTMVAQYAYA